MRHAAILTSSGQSSAYPQTTPITRRRAGRRAEISRRQLRAAAAVADMLRTDPEAFSADPEMLSLDPDALSGDPESLSWDPQTLSNDPDGLSSDPGTLSFDPETLSFYADGRKISHK